jgi:anti-sigma-K factor RskA
MDHQEIKDLLLFAALDRLESHEARIVEEHLRAGCDQCETQLRELREAAATLALSLEGPATGFEERIWRRIEARLPAAARPSPARARDPARRRFSNGRVGAWRATSAVLAAAVVAIAIYAGKLNDHLLQAHTEQAALDSQLFDLRAQLARARDEVGFLQRVLGERARLEQVLSAPDLRLTRLAPLAPALGGGAIVAVSATRKTAVLQASGLPATPAGKTYELWWITKERGPVAAGLFQAEQGHPVIAPVLAPPAGEHVLLSAVTLEPAGGVSKPTGAMYLKGTPGQT